MRLKLTWSFALLAALVTVYIARTHATPALGFVGTTLALGRFGDIDASNYQLAPPLNPGVQPWLSLQKTKGQSDVYVQNNVWQPGGHTGWHTHPGEEVGYIVTGTVEMAIDGRATLTLQAGDGFLIPPRTPHNARDVGPGTGHMLSTYIVEAGQPLASFTGEPDDR